MDSVGCGAMLDADKYGDAGADTLGSVAAGNPDLKLPIFTKLGAGNLLKLSLFDENPDFTTFVSRAKIKSDGKDTTTGHWEIAGLVLDKPFALFPQGFPDEIINYIVRNSGIAGFIGNFAASGTEIIKQLGEEHIKTGKPIIYTSADSVLQIAAHEKYFGLEKLYEVCETARKIADKYNISRVIARPSLGEKSSEFKRTLNRKDFSMHPPRKTVLNYLSEGGIKTAGVGKISDIFLGFGLDNSYEAHSNAQAYEVLRRLVKKTDTEQFVFVNLVDFDMLYGHRRDVKGYGQALKELDDFLEDWLLSIADNELIILTADHGCDPAFKGTDHTRERVPIIAFSPRFNRGVVELGVRDSLADMGMTVAENFKIEANSLNGKSFLPILRNLIVKSS